jgi:rhodanese-related sulfurtransferase
MYIDFITEYWYLFAMLIVTVFMLSMDPAQRGAGGSKTLTPSQLPKLQSRENAVIVDLNEKDKYKEGHISQAINVPFSGLADSLGKLRKHQKKPVVLTCENGSNSRKAVAILKKNDFSDIYTLNGGLVSWRKENLPLEKS